MDFQDVAHASELHNSTSTTDTASNQQSFEKKVNNSTHEDVQNAALPSQSIPLKNLENTTKTETQPQTTSKTTHSGNENANAQTIAASSQVEKTTTHTRSRRSATSAIASEGVLDDTTTTATPNMDDANGASVKSRDVITPQPKDSNTIPTPNVVFEKSTVPNIAYDTMSIKATVVVTENLETGNLQAAVTYNSSGGKSDGVNDTEFNNTVEPPVPQRQTNHHIIHLKHRVNLQLTHQATHLKNQVCHRYIMCHQHLNNQINRNTYQILVATTLI